jgi:cobalt-zinc-cadmium efflux system outer membrane protein
MGVLSLLVASVSAAQERTDRELLDLVVREGLPAAALRAQLEVVRSEQRARLAYPNPAVTYSREGAGFTEFLQAEQFLPIFGSRAALQRAGVAAAAAAEADLEAQLWGVRGDAAAAVARMAAAQARLETADAHTREIERLIAVLRTREQEGEGSRFDRVRSEEELREARQLVVAATVAVAEARTAIAAMLPRDVALPRVAGPLYRPLEPGATDALLNRAVASRAELRALQRGAERASLEADAARRARLPAPTVFAGFKRADDVGNRVHGGIFGVSVGIPIFDSGGREAARWTAESTRIAAERASIERRVQAEILQASDTLAIRQAAAAQESPGAADELTSIADLAYREGEVGILELLDAYRTASRARIRSIDLQLEARLAQVALERAVGDVLWP